MNIEETIVEKIRRIIKKPSKLHAPLIGWREEKYTGDCCRNGEVTYGPHLDKFENHIKLTTGAKYAVAVSSGTAALHLALRVAGVSTGDRVVVPAFTFVATANAVMYCEATPEFVDCDEYGGLSPQKLDTWLSGNKVKAVVCVHVFGHCCDMDALVAVCNKYNVPLIEDAAQAIGSYYKAKHAGTFGIAGVFSFNGNKTITTGGGGAVITNSKEIADRIRHLANVAKEDIPHEFWHAEVGYNYRMPNLNAALGCAQFENLYDIRNRKRYLAKLYSEALHSNDGVSLLGIGPDRTPNHWLNALVLRGVDKRKLVDMLDREGFESRMCWTPLHLLDMYKNAKKDDLSMTMKLASSIINIPSGPGIVD